MAKKHIHLSPEAERGEETGKKGVGGENKVCSDTKETEPIRGRYDKKCKELTSQLAAG